MNQKRMLHSSIWASRQFSRLSKDARLAYIGTITIGDDDGRFKGNPSVLRGELFPYDDIKLAELEGWLSEIVSQNLLVRYEVDGEVYFFHPKWENYQHIREDRRKDSNIPPPSFEFSSVETNRQPNGNQKSGKASDKARLSIVKDSIVKGSKDTLDYDIAFVNFWTLYPNKKAKKAAWRAWQKIKWTPELIQTVMVGLKSATGSTQWVKDDGRYVPHPATWLNGERWNDQVAIQTKKNTKYDHLNTKAI